MHAHGVARSHSDLQGVPAGVPSGRARPESGNRSTVRVAFRSGFLAFATELLKLASRDEREMHRFRLDRPWVERAPACHLGSFCPGLVGHAWPHQSCIVLVKNTGTILMRSTSLRCQQIET